MVKTFVRRTRSSKITWQLLQDPEQPLDTTEIFSGSELLVIQDHPLVVVGSAVALGKQFGPLLPVDGEPVGNHGSDSFEKLALGLHELPEVLVAVPDGRFSDCQTS